MELLGHRLDVAVLPAEIIGRTGGGSLDFSGESAAIGDLEVIFEAWLPDYMGAA